MNFIVSSNTLLRHLQSISGVLSTNSSLPILDNFLFEIIDNKLTVLASDLETTMMTSLEVQMEEAGIQLVVLTSPITIKVFMILHTCLFR